MDEPVITPGHIIQRQLHFLQLAELFEQRPNFFFGHRVRQLSDVYGSRTLARLSGGGSAVVGVGAVAGTFRFGPRHVHFAVADLRVG